MVMPFWSWIVIWSCLGLSLAAVLGISAWRLFAKLMILLEAVQTFFETLFGVSEALEDAVDALPHELSLLRPISEVGQRRRLAKAAAHRRRDSRIIHRLENARALLKVDATTRTWFTPR